KQSINKKISNLLNKRKIFEIEIKKTRKSLKEIRAGYSTIRKNKVQERRKLIEQIRKEKIKERLKKKRDKLERRMEKKNK
ncbi:MAG: hypothetical protein ACOC5R_02070, partial [Elusimicrobiota bacterium]